MAGLNLLTPSGGYVNLSPTNTATNVSLNLPAANGSLISANTGSGAFTTSNFNSASTFGFRNRIINGGMVIDQRNAGAALSFTSGPAATYTLDRWSFGYSQNSKITAQQNQGAVTPPTGFSNYFGFTSASSYSVGSSDYFLLTQPIEGLNVSDLAWGTSNAKTVTLSFQVYSSLTGTFGGSLRNSAANRSYPFSYSVSSANTWTTISVTIPGDTSGTWLTTNGIGVNVGFTLGSGSSFLGSSGAWAGANYHGPTGATSVVGTNGAKFYITGVQLEVGSVASPFDFRSYGQEMSLCQRYCVKIGGGSTNDTFGTGFAAGTTTYIQVPLPVQMRATPTFTLYGTTSDIGVTSVAVAATASGTPSVIGTGINSTALSIPSGTSITSGYGVYARVLSASSWFTMTAEL